MLVTYFFCMLLLFSVTNVFTVRLLMELMFLLLLLYIISIEVKSVGLVVYFSFQSLIPLLLFLGIFLTLVKFVAMLIMAKLGSLPLFYWMIVASLKVGFIGNMFVLGFQKLPVFWILWLVLEIEIKMSMLLVYLSVLYVVINLAMVSDSRMLLIYSSIANTSLLVFSVYGNHYFHSLISYLSVLCSLIYCIKNLDSYFELMAIVFMLLVIPPFILFFMKVYVTYSIDFPSKLMSFIFMLDVFVLLHHFSVIFTKFMLSDSGILVYGMNFLCLVVLMSFSNRVTLNLLY